ncbi:MAG: hypothetical protein M0R77_07870 [Gammaproteobacteria bacterium]|nr:hypothetical protein [Gammaproteobacteria bacterium]
MYYQTYTTKDAVVEAALFEDTDAIGDIVQNLYDSKATSVYLTVVANNPQLADTTHTITITFIQNGVLQVLFLGDMLVFDENDNAIVWNQEDFLEKYELVGGGENE